LFSFLKGNTKLMEHIMTEQFTKASFILYKLWRTTLTSTPCSPKQNLQA
jgi:hypothetical protein